MPNEAVKSIESWRDVFMTSFSDVFSKVFSWLPNLFAMLALLAVGYVLARIALRVATTVADKIGLQKAVERSGLAESMKHVGIQRTVPQIVGQVIFWLLICVFLTAAFHVLGVQAVSDAMNKIVEFIPRLLVAAVVVVIGLLVASFLRGVIATSADRVGLSYAEHLANGCYYLLALMTFLGAFDQLGIQFGMLRELILIGFGALAFGFALAFGLGGRDVMGGILAGYYTRQRMQPGDQVTVCGMEGKVREVGPVATVIETEDDGLVERHTVPNTKMLTEAVR
jgi:hypothetical protein